MLQEIWNQEVTVGDFVKATLVSAAIGAVGCGVMYVVGRVKLNKQLKRIEENTIKEK